MSDLARSRASLPGAALGLIALTVALALWAPPARPAAADALALGLAESLALASPPAAPPAQAQLWSPWRGVGEWGASSAPGAVSWGLGRLDVFARGDDGRLIHGYTDGAGWYWEDTLFRDVTLRSQPSCASWGGRTISCVALREGSAGVWQFYYDGAGWGQSDLGGIAASAPSVVSWGPGRLDVMVRGQDEAMYWSSWQDGTWNLSWTRIDGVLRSAPACTSRRVTSLDCFALDTRGQVSQIIYEGERWSGWAPIPGGLGTSSPVATSWRGERVDVFVRGSSGRLYQSTWNRGGAWSPWLEITTEALSTAPSCVSWGPGRIDCFRLSPYDATIYGLPGGIQQSTYTVTTR
jgi:hypothetical protein